MSDDTESIEDVAAHLSFELKSADLEESRSVAAELTDTAAALREETATDADVESVGLPIDDEYGSLLAGYDEPRRRVSTGPLADYDVAIKDNIAVLKLRMTCGAANFEHVPQFDATVVDRLLDAGATIVGKANMDAFAFGPSGEFSERADVVNPIASDRVPGGSSSGSGVAVAADLVDIALGTDTGGSVRIPAASTGIVGVKPTFGTASTYGVVPFAPSLDTVGPLATDVQTAQEVLHVLQGADGYDAKTAPPAQQRVPDDLTMGVITSFLEASSESVSSAVEHVLDEFGDAVEITNVEIPRGSIEQAYSLVGSTEFAWYVRQRGTIRGVGTTYDDRWIEALGQFIANNGFSDHVAKRVLPAAYLDAREDGRPYVAGRLEGRRFEKQIAAAFEEVDLLLAPTLRTLPPKRGEIDAGERKFDLLGNTAPFNLTGHPAVTVPVAWIDDLPVSLQVIAPQFADDVALAGARLIEDLVQTIH